MSRAPGAGKERDSRRLPGGQIARAWLGTPVQRPAILTQLTLISLSTLSYHVRIPTSVAADYGPGIRTKGSYSTGRGPVHAFPA